MSREKQPRSPERKESFRSIMLASLSFRDFRLVWFGSFSEHLGEFMEVGAILWLVNQLTHSPLMLTIVGACRFISMIFLPIIGGVVADRMNRRTLLIISLIGTGLLSAALSVLTGTGHIAVWHLIVISLLIGAATSFNHPARQAIVPNLVERKHLLNAVSLDLISVLASRMVGMSLVGSLMTVIGVWPIFVLRIAGLILAIVLLLMAKIPATPSDTSRQAPWQSMVGGFQYLKSNAIILGLIMLYLLPWLADNTYTSFVPVFATDILHISATGYGFFQAAPGLGALIALVTLSLLTHFRQKTALFTGAGIVMGLSLLAFAFSRQTAVSLILVVLFGAMQMGFVSINTALIQGAIPDGVRGRVMSLREVTFGLGPAGAIIFGAIAEYIGAPASLSLLGGVCFIVALLPLIAFRKLGKIEMH